MQTCRETSAKEFINLHHYKRRYELTHPWVTIPLVDNQPNLRYPWSFGPACMHPSHLSCTLSHSHGTSSRKELEVATWQPARCSTRPGFETQLWYCSTALFQVSLARVARCPPPCLTLQWTWALTERQYHWCLRHAATGNATPLPHSHGRSDATPIFITNVSPLGCRAKRRSHCGNCVWSTNQERAQIYQSSDFRESGSPGTTSGQASHGETAGSLSHNTRMIVRLYVRKSNSHKMCFPMH